MYFLCILHAIFRLQYAYNAKKKTFAVYICNSNFCSDYGACGSTNIRTFIPLHISSIDIMHIDTETLLLPLSLFSLSLPPSLLPQVPKIPFIFPRIVARTQEREGEEGREDTAGAKGGE